MFKESMATNEAAAAAKLADALKRAMAERDALCGALRAELAATETEAVAAIADARRQASEAVEAAVEATGRAAAESAEA